MDSRNLKNLDPEKFTSEKQRILLNYWLKIRGDRHMPGREDMDPMDIPSLLSGVWLADVLMVGDEVHFKVRLFGTELVRAFQREGTNQNLEEISFAGEIIERLTGLVKTKEAYYCVCDFPIESPDFKYYSTLTLPMSSDNENVDVILSYVHCFA